MSGGRRLTQGVAVVVVVTALAMLVTVAVHADTGPSRTVEASGRAAAQVRERLLTCLSGRARHLISPSEPVHVQAGTLETIIDLEGSIASWASVVVDDDPASALVVLTPGGGPHSCDGYVLTAHPLHRT